MTYWAAVNIFYYENIIKIQNIQVSMNVYENNKYSYMNNTIFYNISFCLFI